MKTTIKRLSCVLMAAVLLVALCACGGSAVRHDVAMTGEITIRGRVLEIGGLREKSMAAYRAGIKTIIIPDGNRSDLTEVDPTVRKNVSFVPGFARVSPKTAFVFGRMAASISASSASEATKLTSMPKRLRVTEKRLVVPP